MPFIFLVSAIVLNYAPAPFFVAGYNAFAFLLEDLQILSIACFGFAICPSHKFYVKVAALLLCCMLFSAGIHNALLNFDVLTGQDSIFYSIIAQMSLFSVIGYIWLLSFDWIKPDDYQRGNMYLVIGKPRASWQWVVFVLTFGRTGTFFFTDGNYTWKFDRSKDCFTRVKFDKTSLYGNKLLKTHVKSDKLDCMVGKKWGMFNNCLTVGLRYGK